MFHTRKYNFDISGESNQRNKFVKCFEHYFLGRKFIVYVQLYPLPSCRSSLKPSNFFVVCASTQNEIKIFDPSKKGKRDEMENYE